MVVLGMSPLGLAAQDTGDIDPAPASSSEVPWKASGSLRLTHRLRWTDDETDFDLIDHQLGEQRALVELHQADLSRSFRWAVADRPLEIVHIDAAKTLLLWNSICYEICQAIIAASGCARGDGNWPRLENGVGMQ